MVSLRCPTCHKVIGEASHEDGYNSVFHYHAEDGQPICPTCDKGEDVPGYKIAVGFAILILIGIGLVNLFT